VTRPSAPVSIRAAYQSMYDAMIDNLNDLALQ
jgi:hypothetical protein